MSINVTAFSRAELPALFNEWMRRFIEEPDRFVAEFRTVGAFTKAEVAGREPNYGKECVAFLELLKRDLEGKATQSNKASA